MEERIKNIEKGVSAIYVLENGLVVGYEILDIPILTNPNLPNSPIKNIEKLQKIPHILTKLKIFLHMQK